MEGIGIENLSDITIQGFRNQHLINLLTSGYSHHHRLSSSGTAVVHRGIGDIHACKLGHHRLVLEDIMEGAL